MTRGAMADIVARAYRGKGIDAIHYGSIAVVDGDGNLTHCLGDPEMTVMTRSSIKPFQVLPLLTTGAAERFGFTDRQVAIMCGSHNGSDTHREVVISNLQAAGNGPSDLKCGTHWPIGMQRVEEYPVHGEDSDPVRHNCSGKHSGFLALARHMGVPVTEYLDPDSRCQQMVRQAVAEMCDYPAERMTPSIDGCSAPNYALPLKNLAVGFMRLATGKASDEVTARALRRVKSAMTTFPEMVSGTYRLDLDLMRSFPGNIVCKVGAEALQAIGFSDPPMGVVIKIHDGGNRARHPVVVSVLKQLGLVDDIVRFPFLMRHERPEVLNNARLLVGRVEADFVLKRV